MASLTAKNAVNKQQNIPYEAAAQQVNNPTRVQFREVTLCLVLPFEKLHNQMYLWLGCCTLRLRLKCEHILGKCKCANKHAQAIQYCAEKVQDLHLHFSLCQSTTTLPSLISAVYLHIF